MSTLIIIGHVKDGVDLGRQHHLPEPIIDFIEQHHGTTLVEYFYHEANRRNGSNPDGSVVPESAFRYPGPKPQTREAAILMIADAVESASRTLSEPTPARLEGLVQRADRQAAPRRPVRRVRADAPRDRRDPREPDQIADRHLPRSRQVSRTTNRLSRPRARAHVHARPETTSIGKPVRSAPQKKLENSIGIEVEISDTQSFLNVDLPQLANLVRRVLEGEGITRAWISLALVNNATIHRINRQHLGHDWATDVISFALSEPDDPELAGELVISAELAVATARELRVAPTTSWRFTWCTGCFISVGMTIVPSRI